MMSLTFGLFTQVSGSGPLGPLVMIASLLSWDQHLKEQKELILPFKVPVGPMSEGLNFQGKKQKNLGASFIIYMHVYIHGYRSAG